MLFTAIKVKNKLFAEWILKLVAGPGIEPRSGAYETPELPLLYPASKLAIRRGFEPLISCVTSKCIKPDYANVPFV